jgi:uncharacterized membrane protein required for colicin V production
VNQVDALILAVILACAVSGARRGLLGAGADIVAIGLGLGLSSLAYPVVATPLHWLGVPPPLSDVLGFLLFAIGIVFLVGCGASLIAENWHPAPRLDKAGGACCGAAVGVLLSSVLLLVSGVVTRTAQPIEQSLLGTRFISLVPRVHETMERVGLPLPKLVQLPTDYREEMSGMRQGLQFLRLNATRLDGAMCIHCRTPVKFEGYKFSRGTLMSPKFRCPQCGRTSDGCQTFEGFHTIYGTCPTDLAKEGVQFDCGVWTNGWYTVPHGPCPVCGKEYVPSPGEDTRPAAVRPSD